MKKGGKDYIPALGWKGFGFNVFDKYDNNLWIGKNNSNGEWAFAYHGIGSGQDSKIIKNFS